MPPVRPPSSVLGAFGADAPIRPLAGGQGTSWAAGDLPLTTASQPRHSITTTRLATPLSPPPGRKQVLNRAEQGVLDATVHLADDEVPAYRIDTPWAVDANGNELPTSYSVNGTTLSQTVDTLGAAFPIVADPAFVPIIIWLTAAAVRAAAPAFVAQTIKSTTRATIKNGYRTFDAFKKKHVTGKEKTHEWHHIVDQANIKRHNWDARTIHNRQNMIQVPKYSSEVHHLAHASKNQNIPGHGSVRGHSSGPVLIRDSVKNLTFERQYQLGVLLRVASVGKVSSPALASFMEQG
ncbi:hypothetical protein [Actinoplanes sp. OR16]|uniref:hypothetical protein n=1 Tax=Actinoplanes sp. OR16 TaxID=946334 RepID=UPI000FD9E8EB|nr:hypothetical protein [Actinoplanes sp. OR16]